MTSTGEWHNRFGANRVVNWNAELKPGPLEFGFDSFFGTPRTHSEPPLISVRERRFVGQEKEDPISVDHSARHGPSRETNRPHENDGVATG